MYQKVLVPDPTPSDGGPWYCQTAPDMSKHPADHDLAGSSRQGLRAVTVIANASGAREVGGVFILCWAQKSSTMMNLVFPPSCPESPLALPAKALLRTDPLCCHHSVTNCVSVTSSGSDLGRVVVAVRRNGGGDLQPHPPVHPLAMTSICPMSRSVTLSGQ